LEDPTLFLNLFMSSTAASGSGWSDPEYDALLVAANAILDPAERMRKLADCERLLLRAMPCMPLYSDVSVFLQEAGAMRNIAERFGTFAPGAVRCMCG